MLVVAWVARKRSNWGWITLHNTNKVFIPLMQKENSIKMIWTVLLRRVNVEWSKIREKRRRLRWNDEVNEKGWVREEWKEEKKANRLQWTSSLDDCELKQKGIKINRTSGAEKEPKWEKLNIHIESESPREILRQRMWFVTLIRRW